MESESERDEINKLDKPLPLWFMMIMPLYSGGLLMALFLPIALGSWLGLIPAAVAALTIVVRIKFEEEMLLKGMEGYQAYQARVKYKLIPKIY